MKIKNTANYALKIKSSYISSAAFSSLDRLRCILKSFLKYCRNDHFMPWSRQSTLRYFLQMTCCMFSEPDLADPRKKPHDSVALNVPHCHNRWLTTATESMVECSNFGYTSAELQVLSRELSHLHFNNFEKINHKKSMLSAFNTHLQLSLLNIADHFSSYIIYIALNVQHRLKK